MGKMAAIPDDCERTATVALPTAASSGFISGEVGISAALDAFSTVYELPLTRFKNGQTDRQTDRRTNRRTCTITIPRFTLRPREVNSIHTVLESAKHVQQTPQTEKIWDCRPGCQRTKDCKFFYLREVLVRTHTHGQNFTVLSRMLCSKGRNPLAQKLDAPPTQL